MCLAMPAQIVTILSHESAVVNLGGIEKTISTILIDNVSVGDYVIIHVGYALSKLNEKEAEKTLALFAELAALDEKAADL